MRWNVYECFKIYNDLFGKTTQPYVFPTQFRLNFGSQNIPKRHKQYNSLELILIFTADHLPVITAVIII